MRRVKAAAVRMSPVLYGREATVERAVAQIHVLGQRGVEFAAFPETVVPPLLGAGDGLDGGLDKDRVTARGRRRSGPVIRLQWRD